MAEFRVSLSKKPLEELTNNEIRELVKKTKETRDQMGGALYFNVLNEEYHNLLNFCLKNGINLNKEEN